MHATASFTVDSWDGASLSKEGDVEIGSAALNKTFNGDLAGTSTVNMLSVTTAAGPAAYVGFERVSGTLHGRLGGFVLHHSAGNGDTVSRLVIVDGSGSGDLAGIRGTATIVRHDDGSHTFTLDYDS